MKQSIVGTKCEIYRVVKVLVGTTGTFGEAVKEKKRLERELGLEPGEIVVKEV